MAVKVHHPNTLDLDKDLARLRALARQDEDPVTRAVHEAHQPVKATAPGKGSTSSQLPATRSARPPATAAQAPAAEQNASTPGPQQAPEKRAAEPVEDPEVLKKKLRRAADIIRHCEALELLNDQALQLPDYPQPHELMLARWRRDLWLLSCLVALAVSVMGLLDWVNPWIAGVAAGLLVLLLAAGIPAVARFCLPQWAGYAELRDRQRQLEYAAIAHVRMLEGAHGLAWHCQMMLDYDQRLGQRRYARMVELSKRRMLIRALRGVGAFRLYLQYLRLAQSAFVRVKQEYVATSGTLKQRHGQF